jgi:hypothetical protein
MNVAASRSVLTERPAGPVFEDVSVSQNIGALFKGPLTTAHLMRWSVSFENSHKIHYDLPFATVEIEFGIRNEVNLESTSCAATATLPLRGGSPLLYPFVAPAS